MKIAGKRALLITVQHVCPVPVGKNGESHKRPGHANDFSLPFAIRLLHYLVFLLGIGCKC